MSDGYTVLMTELLAMARTFSKEAQALSRAVSPGAARAPDGGDPTINAALSEALRTAGLTTGQLAAVVASHGTKLNSAWQKYHDTEQTNARLCQQLTSLITGKQG